MKKYHLVNNIIGWVICAIACAVYILTAEATASWWDCGEYISTAFKLEVGHPPGAPTFQLIGRLFSMFSDPATAAHAVNVMSAVCSGFTILFLYWSITLLGKHLLQDPKNPDVKDSRTWAVFAAGIVGALAYTFTDTFWFSAVEGEVYAMSSMFTSIVFWAILKWEEQSEDPRSLRWLVLICLLIGVAIGVHLLNLLTLPAIVYVVYFKKWPKTTVKGFIWSGVISVLLLAIILWGIIPGIVNTASAFDVFFVNKLHLPFNTGTIFMFLVLAAAIVWGLWYTMKKNKPVINAGILGFVMVMVGYSTFFMLIIRANTNTPLNENAPKDAVAMRAYLGREQYGQTPLLSGQYYTAGKPIKIEKGYTKYVRSTDENGKDTYLPLAYAPKYTYREKHTGTFPRMYSDDQNRRHPQFYQYWAGPVRGDNPPSGKQNLTYMNRYQLGWMYWRYFMWNFAGRQNDIQGHYFNNNGTRDYLNGNWICGIKFIDEARLGPQDNMPDHMKDNKARNTYYLLPLLFGICGLIYHVKKNRKDAFIVFVMFVMTGIAIAIYLNMPPCQPRERDYAFVGSFSFFAIWIGLAVMALSEWITGLLKNEKFHKFVLPVIFVLTMAGAPCLLAAQNWDDHDRSEKYAARDFAKNYLASVKENSILITQGDNDTFPLWYAQEVEGYRTDVRILNYTLSGMSWYVEQLFNTVYESEPMPFTLPKEFYGLDRDAILTMDRTNEFIELEDLMKMMRDNPERFKLDNRGDPIYYLPTKRVKITVPKAELVALGVLRAEDTSRVANEIRWELPDGMIYRHELMMLDILGTNHFRRDINLMSPSAIVRIFPLVKYYCIHDGMNYKVLPYPAQSEFTSETAEFFLNNPLAWGNLNTDIYVDPISLNMGNVQRQTYSLVAENLLKRGDAENAEKLLDLGDEYFPKKNFPRDKYAMYALDLWMQIHDITNSETSKMKAEELWNDVYTYYAQTYDYLKQFVGDRRDGVAGDLEESIQVIYHLGELADRTLRNPELADKAMNYLKSHGIQI